jgi:uridine kinase
MTLKTIEINGNKYNYYEPTSYTDLKLLKAQIKRIKEKIRACEPPNGFYYGKVSKLGVPWYNDYPELLAFLEGLLEK